MTSYGNLQHGDDAGHPPTVHFCGCIAGHTEYLFPALTIEHNEQHKARISAQFIPTFFVAGDILQLSDEHRSELFLPNTCQWWINANIDKTSPELTAPRAADAVRRMRDGDPRPSRSVLQAPPPAIA